LRAVIEMEGGLIQSIISEDELEVLVIDRDECGNPEDEDEMTLPNGEGVIVQMIGAEEDETTVENMFSIAWDGHSGEGSEEEN
jgi:hypothetical protein